MSFGDLVVSSVNAASIIRTPILNVSNYAVMNFLYVNTVSTNTITAGLVSANITSINATINTLNANTADVKLLLANTTTTNTLNANVISANTATLLTNTFSIGTAAYHVSNGNFGIANSIPSDKLSVYGTSNFSNTATFNGTVVLQSLSANNNTGNINQVLTSSGTSGNVYWTDMPQYIHPFLFIGA